MNNNPNPSSHSGGSGRSFSRRRRGGMRFRPKGGPGPVKPDRAANDARAEALGEKEAEESVFADGRHEREIRRAQNVAAGLPPDHKDDPAEAGGYREPNLEGDAGDDDEREDAATVVETPKETFQPVPVKDMPSKSIVEGIVATAGRVITRVKRLIKPPVKRVHKEVIINAESLETRVAVLEDGKLEEFTIERVSEDRLVGSIFKGKVRNLEDGLKAAFVDIGYEKNAFLHYWDIVPSNLDSAVEVVEREGKRRSERPRMTHKDIPKVYPPGSEMIVQVTKGPIGTKGPRVTTHLALPGRYLVLLPNSDQSGVSRKIENQEERQRLKKIVRELSIPDGMGVIIRTVGEGQQARYFVRDLALLLDEWKRIQDNINAKPAPSCAFQEPDLVERTVRDFLTEDVERIVDDTKRADAIRELIGRISKRSLTKVKLYPDSQPIFDRFGITRQLEAAFSRKVNLRGGGYLVIDETEALVAIDVNTGSHKGAKDQDKTILAVNLEAAEEICRQLRLRNIGGLIVLDFIDMRSRRDQQQVFIRMRDGLRRDKAKTHILPISQLGLMEMTRQRQTESVRSSVYQDCPDCRGKGKVKSPETMSVEIQRKLGEILKRRARDESDFQLRIVVNPAVLHRLRTEDEHLLIAMEKKYFGKLSFRADPEFHAEQFKIQNALTGAELASVDP
jgi:ribonuclease G